jgi:protein-S-isoprenylcysteine O-methyltransferase Ste14
VSERSSPIVPIVIPGLLLVMVSVALMIYARVSLGRSIGCAPADRGIITSGPYKYL